MAAAAARAGEFTSAQVLAAGPCKASPMVRIPVTGGMQPDTQKVRVRVCTSVYGAYVCCYAGATLFLLPYKWVPVDPHLKVHSGNKSLVQGGYEGNVRSLYSLTFATTCSNDCRGAPYGGPRHWCCQEPLELSERVNRRLSSSSRAWRSFGSAIWTSRATLPESHSLMNPVCTPSA